MRIIHRNINTHFFSTDLSCKRGVRIIHRCGLYTGKDGITYVKNQVSKGIGIMFKARNYLKRNALVNLYYSFIYPYFIYCIEAWGNAMNCYLKQLYLIQKKVIRMIAFANYNTLVSIYSKI